MTAVFADSVYKSPGKLRVSVKRSHGGSLWFVRCMRCMDLVWRAPTWAEAMRHAEYHLQLHGRTS